MKDIFKYYSIQLIPILFFTWTVNLVMLFLGGKHLSFLAPRFEFFYIVSFCILGVFTVLYFSSDQVKEPKSYAFHWLKGFIFILPLVYAAFSFDAQLGSKAVEKRLVREQSKTLTVTPVEPRKLEKNDEGLSLIMILDNWRHFLGKRVVTVGQIYRGKDVPDGYFMLYRFVVSCCMADARPVAVMIRETEETARLPKDNWLKVEGVLEKTKLNESEALSLKLEKLAPLSKNEGRRYLYN